MNKERTELVKEVNIIEFYCKKCGKSLKMAYSVSGDDNAPVLRGITMRCHTHKCTRVMIMKNFTEGELIAQADKQGRVYI